MEEKLKAIIDEISAYEVIDEKEKVHFNMIPIPDAINIITKHLKSNNELS